MPESREDGMTVDLKAIGSLLARKRGAAGLTQKELAAALTRLLGRQISSRQICRIEKGRAEPWITVYRAWRKYCDEVAEKLDKA